MTEWKTYKIGDLCKISSSKRIFAKEYKDSGIPFYRGKEIIEKQKGNIVSYYKKCVSMINHGDTLFFPHYTFQIFMFYISNQLTYCIHSQAQYIPHYQVYISLNFQ